MFIIHKITTNRDGIVLKNEYFATIDVQDEDIRNIYNRLNVIASVDNEKYRLQQTPMRTKYTVTRIIGQSMDDLYDRLDRVYNNGIDAINGIIVVNNVNTKRTNKLNKDDLNKGVVDLYAIPKGVPQFIDSRLVDNWNNVEVIDPVVRCLTHDGARINEDIQDDDKYEYYTDMSRTDQGSHEIPKRRLK